MKNFAKFLVAMRSIAIIAMVAVIGFSFAACDNGSGGGGGGGGNTRDPVTYTGTAGGVTYTLKIEDGGARAVLTPVKGDKYTLTASGKTSTGTVDSFTGGKLKLVPSKDAEEQFEVTVSGNGITAMSGTITWNEGEPEEAPTTFTPPGGNPGGGGGGKVTVTNIPADYNEYVLEIQVAVPAPAGGFSNLFIGEATIANGSATVSPTNGNLGELKESGNLQVDLFIRVTSGGQAIKWHEDSDYKVAFTNGNASITWGEWDGSCFDGTWKNTSDADDIITITDSVVDGTPRWTRTTSDYTGGTLELMDEAPLKSGQPFLKAKEKLGSQLFKTVCYCGALVVVLILKQQRINNKKHYWL